MKENERQRERECVCHKRQRIKDSLYECELKLIICYDIVR